MDKNMILRKADLQDIEQLVKLRIMMRKEREQDVICNIDSFDILTRQYYEKNLKDDSFICWIASVEEKVIATSGMCFCYIPPTFENPLGKVAYIMNMYTLPEYRNDGIASKLLDKIINNARDRNCYSVILSPSEMGKSIYIKYGFSDLKNLMHYTF